MKNTKACYCLALDKSVVESGYASIIAPCAPQAK